MIFKNYFYFSVIFFVYIYIDNSGIRDNKTDEPLKSLNVFIFSTLWHCHSTIGKQIWIDYFFSFEFFIHHNVNMDNINKNVDLRHPYGTVLLVKKTQVLNLYQMNL